ncbi:MAG: lactate utilization protein [archaeon]|nr:lactate utilization protein [archaeon]
MTTKADVEEFKQRRYSAMARVLIPALEERQYEVFFCRDGKEAADLVLDLIPGSSSVSWGGSVTLEEIGVLDRLKAGDYQVIDRSVGRTPEERTELMRRGLTADWFLTSFNSVSLDGTIYNIDGHGNRVSAIAFGPRQVIAVVGMNKVTKSREEALQRAQDIAAQLNAARFNRDETLFTENDVTEDLPVKGRICNITQELTFCGTPKRIKIILVAEELGF